MEQLILDELWAMNISGSSFYNIERIPEDRPQGGDGQTYIQVNKRSVDGLLVLLGENYPGNGQSIEIMVGDVLRPNIPPQPLVFKSKSQGRMRIANQNRHRATRHPAWSSAVGFPSLTAGQNTADANLLLQNIGGIRIFIARTADDSLWAGFTTGAPNNNVLDPSLSNILYGDKGGHWKYAE